MDFSYNFQGITFEWNVEKAEISQSNHGIKFETACEAFFDPFLRVEDAGVVEGELREAIIGLTVGWKLLYVVYILRDETIRLISARAATSHERKRYENL
jgi:uncharacterized protein